MAARGPSGGDLSIDIGWLGAETPQQALVHSSGIHGVEGFAGSAIQLQLLEQLPPLPKQTALVLAHILNPFGMAWIRRANENNVDLNRNFIADGRYSGAPSHYAALNSFLNPPTGPSRDFFLVKTAWRIFRFGTRTLAQTIAGGQYEFPEGLFFGGKKLEEGLEKYVALLRQNLSSSRKVFAIDVHTGLGRFAEDTLLVEKQDAESLRRIFGSRVTELETYRVQGGVHQLLSSAVSGANLSFMTQEFGTRNAMRVLHALREENRWHHHGGRTLDHPTKQALMETFCPRSEKWRNTVLARGRDVVDRALQALKV